MALCWKMPASTFTAIKTQIDERLSKITIPSFAQVVWKGEELSVLIDKGGKSEFKLGFSETNGDVVISEKKRDVAFFHKPFVGRVEELLQKVMSEAGAQKA